MPVSVVIDTKRDMQLTTCQLRCVHDSLSVCLSVCVIVRLVVCLFHVLASSMYLQLTSCRTLPVSLFGFNPVDLEEKLYSMLRLRQIYTLS